MADAEFVFKKTYNCPICDKSFKNLTVKQGKARPEGSDLDLKQRYKNIEPLKYDVLLCPNCGYASLERYFDHVSARQIKEIKENIQESFVLNIEDNDELTFEESILRYRLALVTCQVKGAKESETGYVCLKLGWLYRSYMDTLLSVDEAKLNEYKEKEEFYLCKAYELLLYARQNEHGSICGMDETTLDCLLSGLSFKIGRYDETKRLIGGILTSRAASKRAKDHARNIKEAMEELLSEESTETAE